ncbi:hypothetical protein KDH83_30770, partial [Achromobacter sp. Marseille-Q0513]|uniref:hypothetical protein n=1 Tax=Achromobacter sp. Marseille-Q0513 TaxID=2829161 RepID=UPI001B962260
MPGIALSSPAKSRFILLCAVLFYGFSISVSHALYLSYEQAYWGFFHPSLDVSKIVAMIMMLAVTTLAMPVRFNRASSVILLLLFLLVFVPGVVINLENHDDGLEKYGFLMGALAFGMTLLFASVRAFGAEPTTTPVFGPSKRMASLFFVAWLICCVLLLAIYSDSMSLQSLGDVYGQRAKGAATSPTIGYVQVYFAFLINPFLFAYGLANRRWLAVAVALCGFLIAYMITAERTVFLLPFAMLLIYQVVRLRFLTIRHVTVLILGFST